MPSVIVSAYIAASPDAVYAFASNPANLPLWVPSFCQSIDQVEGQWIVQSSEGPVVFEFVEPNRYGILDHTVQFSSGLKFTNPMRVMASGSGSEVLFTLFRQEGMTDDQFAADEAMVRSDLDILRGILEGKSK